MPKDKNADKRFEYNLKISEKERETEELQLEERQTVQTFENFEEIMMQSFREIQEIEADINKRSHIQNAFSETEQKKRYFSQLISNQKEELSQEYKKKKQMLEDERETLEKERDNLAWD
ncbi:hypothetical protein ACFO26_05415 [Lactococcus nasutitermitis]|uniref:Flagellar FliJ protein n=1 Tax=Lactococcus nasutitermitis TaxID=1652957 RepID=A0ABV9JEH9_9LACT|nr:hypothetical protein [Lactococcus nasutitermitis]